MNQRPSPWRRAGSAVVLVASTAALLATSYSGADLVEAARGQTALEPGAPAVLQHVRVAISQAALTPPDSVERMSGAVILDLPKEDDLEVTLLGERPDRSAPYPEDVLLLDIDACDPGAACEREFQLLFENHGDRRLEFEWTVEARVGYVGISEVPDGAAATIEGADEPGRPVGVRRATAKAGGVVRIDADRQTAELELIVGYEPPPTAMLSSATATLEIRDTGPDDQVDVDVSFVGNGPPFFDGQHAWVIDPLVSCADASPCQARLPLVIESDDFWLLSGDAWRRWTWELEVVVTTLTEPGSPEAPTVALEERMVR